MMRFPASLIQTAAESAAGQAGQSAPALTSASRNVLLGQAGETAAAGILPLQTVIVTLCCLVVTALYLLARESRLENRPS